MSLLSTIFGGLSATGNLGTSIWSNIQNQQNNKWTQQFAESQAQQNQANIETQWNREDTAFQRQQADLEQAGLNKSLAYGGATGSSSSTGATGQTSGAMGQMHAGVDMLNPLLQAQQVNNQTKEIDAKIGQLQADMSLKLAQAQKEGVNTKQAQKDLDINMVNNLRSSDNRSGIFKGYDEISGRIGNFIDNELSKLDRTKPDSKSATKALKGKDYYIQKEVSKYGNKYRE